ncbi:MAG TPA: response regulator transcription factor [Candidatus Sulfotelmatobacter sp.]|jgi:DNA-binding NarL/FixJ family response regulator|nr:response regulator transcription factor [Candidatus Sulfotelmatobacter sp.]
MRVLLADDHVMFREGMRPFLNSLAESVEILDAGSLSDVLAHLDAGVVPDLTLLDMKMPGMAGAASVAAVKERLPDKPVVVLSGLVDRDLMINSINAGASGYIPKKLSGAAMVSAIRLMLSGERFLPVMLLNTEPGASDDNVNPSMSARKDRLTRRERDILMLLKDGLPNKVIASKLTLSEVTVKSHLCSIFRKLGVSNRVQAIRCFTGENLG